MDAWTTRTHGRICNASRRLACIDPSHPHLRGVVHRFAFGLSRSVVSHLRGAIRLDSHRVMDPLGFEPRASSLQRRHSPTELWAHLRSSCGTESKLASTVQRCPIGRVGGRVGRGVWATLVGVVPVCGGDPAADSPTATLLRLKPPCEAQIRPPGGGLIRTSLGCFDGRCVQGAGTYSPRLAEARLLPNPAS